MSPEHGGRLNQAARRWGIPRQDWLDLSTGISPWSWPVPVIPEVVWRRLPEDDDGLATVCREAWSLPAAAGCLPVPGSQAALQTLPRLRAPCRVGVPDPGYAEHALAWSTAGHDVVALDACAIETALPSLDVLVCINPNNPSGKLTDRGTLLRWHRQLADRGGWLVVDEAFLDASEGDSLAPYSDRPGLIVLRSLGKFYGLAGVRAGLMLADPALCECMDKRLGPWAVSHPARFVMAGAVQDRDWRQQQRQRLRQSRQALDQCLLAAGLVPQGDCDLFVFCSLPDAGRCHEHLARQGILVRHFPSLSALRLGLPGRKADLCRLQQALRQLKFS